MTTPTPLVREPVVDTPVYTLDGQQFGYVKEVRQGYFKIDVPMAKDYWLSRTYIAESSLDKVGLTLRKEEVEGHRLSEPGVEGQEPSTGIVSDVEMLEQRERMERELEAQREKMKAGLI